MKAGYEKTSGKHPKRACGGVRETPAPYGQHLVRFDWAIKRLLRHKADFVVVNGFLTSLLGRNVSIIRALESESNARSADDRINRVDVLVEDEKGTKYIIEVQTTTEVDFFHRMVYGVSKVITEYIKKSEKYGVVKKVFSVNIVYFSLGQGKDYAYRGATEFRGMHVRDVLQLSKAQREKFGIVEVGDVFPEYFVLRVDEFDGLAKSPLDEWIYFLKHSVIPEGFSAPGLDEARERLAYDNLTDADRRAYDVYVKNNRYEEGVLEHYKLEGLVEGRAEGRAEGHVEGHAKGRAEGRAEGHAEGHAEGRAEGHAEGRTEGHAEGHAEGRAEGRMATLRETEFKLKAAGMTVSAIAAVTGLAAGEIERL
jgi:predicted transposase/invertase (TIGR01784 family)